MKRNWLYVWNNLRVAAAAQCLGWSLKAMPKKRANINGALVALKAAALAMSVIEVER